MATSGTINGTITGYRPYLRINWSRIETDVAGNRSKLRLQLYLMHPYTVKYSATKSGVLQGTSFTSSTSVNGTGSTLLRTQDIWVGHNADGSKTQGLSASFNIAIKFSGVNLDPLTVSGNAAIDAIPRGSTLSAFSFASSLQIGTKNTINYTVTRHSGNFRHQFQLRDGSVTVAQWDNVDANGSSSLELTGAQVDTILGRMSTVTSKTFTLRLSTRSGHNGGWIGSSVTRDATVSVNANVEPTISSTSATPIGNSWAVGKGFYVQGQTGVQAEFSSAARGGAGVKSRSISIGSLSNGGAVVGSVFRHSQTRVNITGNITITYKITDTRDRTVSSTRTVNFRAYTPPKVTSFTVGRSNPTSPTVTIKSQGSIHGMGGENTGTMTVTQKGVSGNVRSQSLNNTTPSFNDSFNRTVATSVSTDFTITVTDLLGNSATSASTVGTAFMEFSIRKGTGVGIGKTHEHGVLDVDGPASFGWSDFDSEGQVPVVMQINTSGERTGLIQGKDPNNSVVWQIGNRMQNARALYLEAYDSSGIRMNATNVRINNDIIADSGTHANGDWVRFYDGTQICWNTVHLTYKDPSHLELYWEYPVAFINDKTSGSFTRDTYWGGFGERLASPAVWHGSINVQIRLWAPQGATWGTTSTVRGTAFAIGRWK